MEILRNVLGNLSSGVIRLAVAVGILAAVGIFIVRPVLDSTEKIAKEGIQRGREINREVNGNLEKSLRGINSPNGGLGSIDKVVKELPKQIEAQIRHSFHAAKAHGVGSPKRLLKCIRRADGDPHKITRCTARF